MPRPRAYREVVKILRDHDPRFEFHEARGKGSHRMIYHPDVDGQPASFPVKYHGKATELRRGVISAIVRRFNLPRDLF